MWGYALWDHMWQCVGVHSVKLCSMESMRSTGTLCSVEDTTGADPTSLCKDPPKLGVTDVPNQKTPTPCNIPQPCCTPLLQFQSLDNSQRALLALETFQNRGLLFLACLEVSLAPKRLIAMKPRLVFAAPLPPRQAPARSCWQPSPWGIYSSVNFEHVQQASRTSAGDMGTPQQSWRLARSQPWCYGKASRHPTPELGTP